MTDKANAAPRAEQAAEAAAKNAAQGETSALQDFVAGLLPKIGSKDSSPNGSQSGSITEREQNEKVPQQSKEGSGRSGDGINSLDDLIKRLPKEGSPDKGDVRTLPDLKDKIGQKGDIINDKKIRIDDLQIVGSDEKGVIKLQTGDTLVRAGGMEVLVTKGGGSIVVKPDGSYEVTGGTVKHNAKTGETTVDFGNGRSATIRDGKIDSVTDGNTTAWMVSKPNRLDDMIKPKPYPRDWEEFKPLPHLENKPFNKKPMEEMHNNSDSGIVPKKLEK